MSTPTDGWTCGRCGHANGLDTITCGACARRLSGDVVAGGEALGGADWVTLLLAPLRVFFAVAGADGHVHDDEVVTLRRMKPWRDASDDPLFLALASVVLADFWGVLELYHADGRSVHRGLTDAVAVLDRALTPERAATLRLALVRVGVAVARSSRGGLLGFGARVHPSEARVITNVASTLGLSDDAVSGLGVPPTARG